MTEEFAIVASDLTKSYARQPVLGGVSLQVPRGTVFALLGPNGAGKTTLVRILATLIRPDSGQARVAGFDIVRERHEVRRRISLTGQYAAVDEFQTGEENLRMMARLVGLSAPQARRRAFELLEAFDLVEAGRRRVATYSGGMRRRLDLVASLIAKPDLIFLDEPTTGLDPRSRQAVWDAIRGLVDSGVTVFLTTQYLEEADQLADHIALLDGGRIVAQGTVSSLKQQIGGQRLDLILSDPGSYHFVDRYLGERVIRRDATSLTLGIATDGSATQIRELLDEVDPRRSSVERISLQSPTLDDVFFALTGHRAGAREQETANV